MSISSPQNRDEFKQYCLTKIGAPVIEINVADEQIDIAIDDAFQFYNERSHFLGTERMYLTSKITSEFVTAFGSFRVQETPQVGGYPTSPIPGRPTESAEGMVDELTLISPGAGYPSNEIVLSDISTRAPLSDIEITTEETLDIQTDAGGNLIFQTKVSGVGSGL